RYLPKVYCLPFLIPFLKKKLYLTVRSDAKIHCASIIAIRANGLFLQTQELQINRFAIQRIANLDSWFLCRKIRGGLNQFTLGDKRMII
ncbi:MAG: hypothetical protein KKA35_08430, partial [Proteobacteria bacterium]|nr:hypothetical protein [Pseudomonadota bacterium]